MRQYVLTRSAFPPALWSLADNRARLAVTRAVTAPLMAAQTLRDWTWIVLLDPRDPLLAERVATYEAAAPTFCPLLWTAPDERRDRRPRQALAADAYHGAPWRSLVGPADDTVLLTRIDDDDGFAPDALGWIREAAEGIAERTILVLPSGVWLSRGAYVDVIHRRNAWQTLVTPPGDEGCVYGYPHTKPIAPVRMLERRWGWVWVRHEASISGRSFPRGYMAPGWRGNPRPIPREVRQAFPLDWPALARVWSHRR